MSEAKQKQNKKENETQHVFEIHTMAKDNEAVAMNPSASSAQVKSEKPAKKEKKPKKKPFKKEQPKKDIANPFLTEAPANMPIVEKQSKKESLQIQPELDESVEKINFSTKDIVKQDDFETVPPKKKGFPRILIVVFLIIFIVGAVGYAAYMYMNKMGVFAPGADNSKDIVIDVPEEPVDVDVDIAIGDPVVPTYVTDMPNYLVLDVESLQSNEIVAEQLNVIEENMIIENITGPISFVVRDLNKNPISFHVFAMSANMDIPQEVLASLEETFELYAYRDPSAGVRFGFAIDIKNVDLLREALTSNEGALPEGLLPVLGNVVMNEGVVFSDSTHGTHPIRFANLDQAKTYSIDYTLTDLRLVIGTSKNTLRAVLDSFKGVVYTPETAMLETSEDATLDTPLDLEVVPPTSLEE